jgi:hypothetical protein
MREPPTITTPSSPPASSLRRSTAHACLPSLKSPASSPSERIFHSQAATPAITSTRTSQAMAERRACGISRTVTLSVHLAELPIDPA